MLGWITRYCLLFKAVGSVEPGAQHLELYSLPSSGQSALRESGNIAEEFSELIIACCGNQASAKGYSNSPRVESAARILQFCVQQIILLTWVKV
ncbi:MAG: hypothetical protein JRF56_11245 [Deltaproteobacteria bacterium]|jgi:hypothetical protein|nr:hypothetical protein [Deltaproteobacteria bacterium]